MFPPPLPHLYSLLSVSVSCRYRTCDDRKGHTLARLRLLNSKFTSDSWDIDSLRLLLLHHFEDVRLKLLGIFKGLLTSGITLRNLNAGTLNLQMSVLNKRGEVVVWEGKDGRVDIGSIVRG